jgi:hypothetical protein
MPFTVDQFLKVFESYNQAIYPAQWVLLTLALSAVFMAVKPNHYSGKIIAGVLALLWAWTGVAYHLLFFTRINRAAYIFGLLCVVQAAVFFFSGVIRNELNFRAKPDAFGIVGGVLIAFSLFIYPALGLMFDHVYPRSPTFGAPCPATIFTFGLLLWVEVRVPSYVLVIPLVWSLIGFSAALTLGVREDLGLLVAGIVGSILILRKNKALSNSFVRATL